MSKIIFEGPSGEQVEVERIPIEIKKLGVISIIKGRDEIDRISLNNAVLYPCEKCGFPIGKRWREKNNNEVGIICPRCDSYVYIKKEDIRMVKDTQERTF